MFKREIASRRADGVWRIGDYLVSVSQSRAPIDASEGGDRTDAFVCPDGTLHLCVLDACGHGAIAERVATFAMNALRVVLCSGASPSETLSRLERLLVHLEEGDRTLMTAIIVSIDASTRELVYASAGHVDAILLDARGHRHLAATGPILGLPEAIEICDSRVSFASARSLVVPTDGIVDSRASGDVDRTLGTSGLSAMSHALASRAGALSASRLMVEARRRAGGAFLDDAAVLVSDFEMSPSW